MWYPDSARCTFQGFGQLQMPCTYQVCINNRFCQHHYCYIEPVNDHWGPQQAWATSQLLHRKRASQPMKHLFSATCVICSVNNLKHAWLLWHDSSLHHHSCSRALADSMISATVSCTLRWHVCQTKHMLWCEIPICINPKLPPCRIM